MRFPLDTTSAWTAARSLAVCLVLLAAAGARGDIIFWPGSYAGWTPFLNGGGLYTDPVGDINPDWLDIVGDTNLGAGFWAFSDAGTPGVITDDEIMFRIRIEQAPNNPNSVWQVFMDVSGNGLIDFSLQVDESGDDMVELVAALPAAGNTFDDVNLDTAAIWSGSIAGFSRFVEPTDDGSDFGGGSNDAFVDFGMPWETFATLTGASGSNAIRFGLSSSASHSGINKDLPFALTGSDPVSAGLSDAIFSIPEPSTGAILAGGLLVVALLRRRVRTP